jgi:YggT family protein
MIISILIQLVHFLSRALQVVIIIDIVISYFMSPYHPLRRILDRFVSPMLIPIRKYVPAAGMVDFSPLILILIIQLVDFVLTNILLAVG